MLATQLRTLPIIDFELGKQLVGDRTELIQDILSLLIDSLPSELETIKTSYDLQEYECMLAAVHRLHGAVCYSPTPRLKLVLSHLETRLKNNIIDELPLLLKLLELETKEVIKAKNFT